MLSMELDGGLDPTTLRSGPDPKPRVRCSTHGATQVPQILTIYKKNLILKTTRTRTMLTILSPMYLGLWGNLSVLIFLLALEKMFSGSQLLCIFFPLLRTLTSAHQLSQLTSFPLFFSNCIPTSFTLERNEESSGKILSGSASAQITFYRL